MDVALGLHHELGVVAGVAGVDLRGLLVVAQVLQRVMAHRVEQPVAVGAVPGRDAADHRLGDQVGQSPDDRHRVVRQVGDRLGRGQREVAQEHAQPHEQLALRRVEQVEAPVERRPQRAVAGRRPPAGGAEQPEAVVEAHADLADRQAADQRGRQLDRQRDAVEPRADLGHAVERLARRGEAGQRGPAPLQEQLHRLGPQDGVGVDPDRAGVGQPQRADAQHALGRHLQVLPARGQDAGRRAALQHGLGRLGGGLDDVLAVVEHDQHLVVADRPAQVVERPGLVGLGAERRAHRPRDQARFGHGRQVDEPDAGREPVDQLLAHADRQARLAAPGRAAQGDESRTRPAPRRPPRARPPGRGSS